MDTVRSEYSEGSIASSRLDDGSATGRASLSFSLSNSHTSRLSIDSASTRSDYLANYERKFLERKASKHKKSEKAKRDKEKADRQQLFSADQRRKAEREAERQARRQEMETWLTDPNELKRIERRSQRRSRDRMRALKEWYAPATSGPHEEVQPVFVEAMNQVENNQETGTRTRKKVAKPLLPKEAAALKDEEDREALEAVLQRQLNAFTTKLEYLEQFVEPVAPVRAKTRAGPRRRRRLAREDMHLAPLGPARSNLHAVKSLAHLPSHYVRTDDGKLGTSVSMQMLRPLSRLHVDNNDADDAQDDAEVEEYLMRHRKVARQAYAVVKLQATWRMYLRRRKYLPWRQRRTRHRRAVFEIWVMTYRVGYRAQRSLLRKYFSAWHADVVEALQLREMELQLFRQAATQAELPRMVLNLVFTSDWEDERAKRIAAKASEAAKKKDSAPTSKAAFLGAFLSAAFGDVESASDKGRSRIHRLRVQHIAAREEVRKKVVQHVFRLWKRVHEAKKRVGLNAQLCLKRAVRMAFGTRQRWPAETLLTVFEIWSRWATFNRCKRLGLPLPRFAQSNRHWDVWLHNYQERQVRCVKAAAKAPGARLRRYFLRFHAFAQRLKRERHYVAIASDHYFRTLRRNVLVKWREAIAGSAANKKLVRGVLLRFHRYACAKRKLRPLKLELRQRQCKWLWRRAWRGWKRVQLHTCFKRELNLSRLENSQMWRSRLHRTLDIWRDERESLLVCRTFEAWTHFVRKRKLFLTLRMICARQQRRNLLNSVFNAWKAAKWDRVDGFLEDRLRLDAWDAYRELSVFFPMLFYGSFSDAGSSFGGLPSYTYSENTALPHFKQLDHQELMLATSGDAVRHFHGALVRDSVVEVRNAILQARHLVNAIDDASGNTALHVAAQIEEPERRLEILSLLLSEGAATLKRKNRHGLSPIQLAPDPDTRYLLGEGIFAFHSRGILKSESIVGEREDSQRLMWCLITLMSREWGVGTRLPADVRTGQWHSCLGEERWLRQKQIRFSPYSKFASAVIRSRGFLNALKTRLCLPHHDFLFAAQPRKSPRNLQNTKSARDKRYQEWEERLNARKSRASETGEYEAYARYLLASTLDTEACEQELIPNFVGLLYSLGSTSNDVLQQAFRLEKECTKTEGELWELYQRIRTAEISWSSLFATNVEDSTGRYDVGMLRLFSDDADADLFFRREVFLLEFDQFNRSKGNKNKDGLNVQQEALALEIDTLLIRTQRKLRKAEKKVKRIQDLIDASEQVYRRALFATPRDVEAIVVSRMALEHAHLRMAMALIKLSEIKAVVSRLEYAKRVLQTEASQLNSTVSGESELADAIPPWAAGLTYNERKSFLEAERLRYSHMFQSRVIMEEARVAAKKNAGAASEPEPKTEELPETLHQLQKEATSKLHTLFMLNLFRSCCCWLAENLLATEEAMAEDDCIGSDNETDADSDATGFTGDSGSTLGRNSVGAARLLSVAGAILGEEMSRRRSSIKNTRRVLETYHQGFTSMSQLDPDNESMNTTYAVSAGLLFEEERRAAQEAEREKLNTTKVEVVTAISERNPMTGELEKPPNHIVSIDAISAPEPMMVVPVVETKEVPRNRKKEELQRARMHRKLYHKQHESSESDSDDSVDSQQDALPAIHGTGFHFGNFVAGDGVWTAGNHNVSAANGALKPSHPTNIESMWKRGGIKLADGTAPSIKEVLAHAHQISSREKLRSGNRRQAVVMKDPPELSPPEETVPETHPVESPPSNKRSGPLHSGKASPVNVNEIFKRRSPLVGNRRPLGRAVSMSCLLPGTNSTPALLVLATKSESEQHLQTGARPSLHDGTEQNSQPNQESTEMSIIPAVQINTRSLLSTSRPVNTESTSSTERECNTNPDREAEQSNQQLDLEVEEKREIPDLDHDSEPKYYSAPKPSVNETLPSMHDTENTGSHEVEIPAPPLQSPIVEISTSRTSDLPSNGQRCNRYMDSQQTLDAGDGRLLQNDSLATSVSAFIKWEEGTVLEAFPLAVVPNNHPKSVTVGDKRSSPNREKGTSIPRISSIRVTKHKERYEEIDELTATKFVLDDSADWTEVSAEDVNEVFTLHGKSLSMTKKSKRVLRKRRSTGGTDFHKQSTKQLKEIQAQSVSRDLDFEADSSDSAPLVRPISVTVVTKPAKREVEVPETPEVHEVLPMSEVPRVKTPLMSPAKPFVKLEGAVVAEKDKDSSPALQLEGLGLGTGGNTANTIHDLSTAKQDKPKLLGQASSPPHLLQSTPSLRVPARHSHKPEMSASSSSESICLQGARLRAPVTSETKSVEKPVEITGFEGIARLSKAEKERIWQEFAAEPLSSGVHEAYTILYPQTYVPPATTARNGAHDAQTILASGLVARKSSSAALKESPSSSHFALRVDSTRQPLQNAMELDRKFWSAVEGYRAIGSSSLVPLDAATIAQRRQDKARAIYDQFFCGQRTNAACSDYRGLALAWLDMYPKEVADVRRQLSTAPKGLFDMLQRTAELQIAAALADKHRVDEAPS